MDDYSDYLNELTRDELQELIHELLDHLVEPLGADGAVGFHRYDDIDDEDDNEDYFYWTATGERVI